MHEPVSPCHPRTENKEYNKQGLDNVIERRVVANNNRAVAHHVAKQISMMELLRFAEKILL